MLKFHTNDTTALTTFEDFILMVYVIVDELYRRYAPLEVIITYFKKVLTFGYPNVTIYLKLRNGKDLTERRLKAWRY